MRRNEGFLRTRVNPDTAIFHNLRKEDKATAAATVITATTN